MKLILLSLLTVAHIANADVVKPINTLERAVGTASIDNLKFAYSVLDNGWRTSGHVYPGPVSFEAQKQFILEYVSSETVPAEKQDQLSIQVKQDAEQKCLELGTIEFANQTADLPQKYVQKTFKAEILKSNFHIYEVAAGVYNCRVTVVISE